MINNFYLDTNVYRHLVERNRNADQELLRQNKNRLRLTAVTALELLEDLATSSPERYPAAWNTLDLARRTSRVVLPGREEFLARHLFHRDFKNTRLSSTAVAGWINVAVLYRSKDQIGRPVKVGASKRPRGLDLSYIEQCQKEFRDLNVGMICRYVKDVVDAAGVKKLPPRGGPLSAWDASLVTLYFESPQWRRHYVRMWAESFGRIGLTDCEVDQLYPSLKPACEFLSSVLLKSLRDAYNFKKNANDVADEAQLAYLCEPSLTFVTEDRRLRAKLSKDSLSRVLSFDEFRACVTR